MNDAIAASLVDAIFGAMPAQEDESNRVLLEGLTFGSTAGGEREIRIRRVELSGLKVRAPVVPGARATAAHPATGTWRLGPLGATNGTLRAEIVDAHLLFDADVTVPVVQGQVDLGDATVEHVGPDSRMGVSRMGLYVDAPNGRSYLYQFASAPVAGVEYEQRGALLGPRVTARGKLQLQPFLESLLGQPHGSGAGGFTEQSRQLFDRTKVAGELRLGDGRFAAPGVEAELAGRAQGCNTLRVHSEAVGRGFTVDVGALSVRDATLGARGTQLHCEEIAGAITLRVFVEEAQLCVALEIASLAISGVRLRLAGASGAH